MSLKDDFAFWVNALPSRAHGAAIIQSFENCTWFAFNLPLVHPVLKPHAGPRLGGFPALATTYSTTSAALLTLKGRSGASPYQSSALSPRAKALGYSVRPFHGQELAPASKALR